MRPRLSLIVKEAIVGSFFSSCTSSCNRLAGSALNRMVVSLRNPMSCVPCAERIRIASSVCQTHRKDHLLFEKHANRGCLCSPFRHDATDQLHCRCRRIHISCKFQSPFSCHKRYDATGVPEPVRPSCRPSQQSPLNISLTHVTSRIVSYDLECFILRFQRVHLLGEIGCPIFQWGILGPTRS